MRVLVDRRKDGLLRGVVEHFRPELERCGFQLARRGNSTDHSWVQFRRETSDPTGRDGTQVVTMAHGVHERALLVDSYFVDSALSIETPTRKVVHRYGADSDLAGLVREVMGTIRGWTH
jgi:hypothetical protein